MGDQAVDALGGGSKFGWGRETWGGDLHLVGEVFGVQWGSPQFPSALLPTHGPQFAPSVP